MDGVGFSVPSKIIELEGMSMEIFDHPVTFVNVSNFPAKKTWLDETGPRTMYVSDYYNQVKVSEAGGVIKVWKPFTLFPHCLRTIKERLYSNH